MAFVVKSLDGTCEDNAARHHPESSRRRKLKFNFFCFYLENAKTAIMADRVGFGTLYKSFGYD